MLRNGDLHQSLLYRAAKFGRRTASRTTRSRAIKAYLATHRRRRLCVGSGRHTREGWLTVDITPVARGVVFLDAAKSFPIPTASFDVVFSEHMIEHIPYEAGRRMLGECRRVLRSRGVMRIATPNVQRITGLLGQNLEEAQRGYVEWSNARAGLTHPTDLANPAFVVNRFFSSWGHSFLYDAATLEQLLRVVGFSEVRECTVGQSVVPDLVGIERHHEMIGVEPNLFETMVLEAIAS